MAVNEVPLRVLLVDDEVAILRAVGRLLRREGYRVATAHGVASARRALERSSFDIAVLDIDLGDGSGLTLAEPLHERGTRVVFFSGSTEVEPHQLHGRPMVRKSRGSEHLLEAVRLEAASIRDDEG